ncbi:MAG TPA: hypothetical protein VOB72_08095, partial [Candidatus Dormibacteraeota bacterium]|nr:hypothetical protein [Candidatus Dormibacteraeota bacterium]
MRGLDLRNVRAIVTDAEVLGRLEPDAVADYLARNGWIRSGGRKTGGVWSREIDSTRAAAVFLPDDPTYADYAVRMGELLAMLARVEDRSQLAVLAALIGTGEQGATAGGELIAAERQRLIEAEGRTPEHDDQHDGGELIEAAR